MLNWFRTKKTLLAQIDELKQSRVNLQATNGNTDGESNVMSNTRYVAIIYLGSREMKIDDIDSSTRNEIIEFLNTNGDGIMQFKNLLVNIRNIDFVEFKEMNDAK